MSNPNNYKRLKNTWNKSRKKIKTIIFKRDKGTCQNCGFNLNGEKLRYIKIHYGKWWFPPYIEIDHIIPLSNGGDNKLKNLQLLCNICNYCKGVSVDNKWKQSKKMLQHYKAVNEMVWRESNNETTITNY